MIHVALVLFTITLEIISVGHNEFVADFFKNIFSELSIWNLEVVEKYPETQMPMLQTW